MTKIYENIQKLKKCFLIQISDTFRNFTKENFGGVEKVKIDFYYSPDSGPFWFMSSDLFPKI